MTRAANDIARFTPFSRWVRKYCKDSKKGLSLTNLDFIMVEYKQKKVFMLEEKQYMSDLKTGQRIIFQLVDGVFREHFQRIGYDYWGFFLIQLPKERPEEGMKLNYKEITSEQLKQHIDFEKKFCESLFGEVELC
jgi:hypothetical protein